MALVGTLSGASERSPPRHPVLQKESGRAHKLLSRPSSTRLERQRRSTQRAPFQNAQVLDGMFTEPLFAHALFVDEAVAVQPASLKSRQHA
jgi:hypothetical protein